MTGSSHAVFLSYASEDASAAQRIAEALRGAGIEVWFDKSELRGGDAWDHNIRRQIRDCVLFVPIISGNSEARPEGYFRLEWDLADQRSHMIVRNRAFIVPVCLDGTPESDAGVPESFQRVQWTRLPGGETPPAFVERVRRLLAPEASPAQGTAISDSTSLPKSPTSVRPPQRSKAVLWLIVAVIVVTLVGVGADRFFLSRHSPPPAQPAETAREAAVPGPVTAVAFNPPPHSIAVLPFVNMSGDKEQEYFSDGLTEELLNSLSRINELQVAARTSSFSFKGKNDDVDTIAHKLNVGAILEGSVRRSANTVRITAQLVNGVTGFHLWSQTYDRGLGNMLQLQTDIATAVASALKVELLGDVAAKIEAGGTQNAAAMDAYLRAKKAYAERINVNGIETAIYDYTKAIELDPNYALAYAERSIARAEFAANYATSHDLRATMEKAEADARKALALSPELGLGHLALASVYESKLDFGKASKEYERAKALGPGSARILNNYGFFAVCMGKFDAGLDALHRAVTLDPLSEDTQNDLGLGLSLSRRYKEALEVMKRAQTLNPEDPIVISNIGIVYHALGDYKSALNWCEKKPDDELVQSCLAIVYDKLGRHGDAQTMLARMRASRGDADAVSYAWVFAQWGQTNNALAALDTAMRLRSPYLEQLKTAALFDPLRKEPRFQAIERALKFPD